MISKYVNPFDGLDTGDIAGKIRNFITTLNDINYESSGCFMMSTNAAYDGSFNEAATKLKTEDIQKMIDLCNQCIQDVIAKIVEFNSYYDGTYTSNYDTYTTAYKKLSETPKSKTILGISVPNPAYGKAKRAKDAAEKVVKEDHTKMDTDVGAINSVSF